MDAETQLVVDLPAESARAGARARAVGLIGPVTVVAGDRLGDPAAVPDHAAAPARARASGSCSCSRRSG